MVEFSTTKLYDQKNFDKLNLNQLEKSGVIH
jgi:hypothetical protein